MKPAQVFALFASTAAVAQVSLLPRDGDPVFCKTCEYLVNKAITGPDGTETEPTEAGLASTFHEICADAAEDLQCQPFLDAHEEELIPQVVRIGEDLACVEIKVCTVKELSEAKAH